MRKPSRTLALATLCAAALALAGGRAEAVVTIPGGNIVNQTWRASLGPYIIQGDITVPAGAFLTIEPGVEVQLATTDMAASGLDPARVEVTINGTLTTMGSAASPVLFRGATAGVNRWYGIRIGATASATVITGATVRDSNVGVEFDGTATIDGGLFTGNTTGVRVNATGVATVSNAVFTANTNAGVLTTGAGARATVDNSTFNANYDGVTANAGSLAVTDSIITNQSNYGVRRSGSGTLDVTYSNVWANGLNYFSATGGTGTISANPLYVSASNVRLTSNSPSRFGAMSGGDQGALPYAADATPGLHGVLWVNTTLTAAGSPYAVAGDLTVASGVTLSIPAGVRLQMATTDLMAANTDPARVELIVLGTLATSGTAASPVTFAGVTAGVNRWYGVHVRAGSTASTVTGATVRDSNVGVELDGTAVLDACFLTGNTTGTRVNATGVLTLRNAIMTANNNAGVLTTAAGARATVVNCTANANYDGLTANAGSIDAVNCLVTNQSNYGIRRSGSGTINVTHSNVWGNGLNYFSATGGTGTVSTNPFYVSPSDLRLMSTSPAIDSGTNAGAPTRDYAGAIRPLDGDGIGGAVTDMGAYEYVTAMVCGNGVTETGEACDDGPRNGTYGACNLGCSGAGPRCGDGTRNGPEECDDANPVDTDACRNTCLNARCGDGVTRAGTEACDDGNAVNTDACTNLCAVARCGDGVTQAGVEQCDDANPSNTDDCVNTCADARCGDGFVRAGRESCDDGPRNGMPGFCNASCTSLAARCGDGVVNGAEVCDDGLLNGTYGACNASCTGAGLRCGDGTRNGPEECDDANPVDTDACRNTCVNARCGDGVTQSGVEQCDDANPSNTDACTNLCLTARCGDGLTQMGVEDCDDGNPSNTDLCTNVCRAPRCGDGFTQAGEACDDGDVLPGDGCSATCAIEPAADAGVSDAAVSDAMTEDAATSDAATGDAGVEDSGAVDAAMTEDAAAGEDVVTRDAAAGDAALADARALDAAGDAGTGGAGSGCGCRVPGASGPRGRSPATAAFAMLAVVGVVRRRRRAAR